MRVLAAIGEVLKGATGPVVAALQERARLRAEADKRRDELAAERHRLALEALKAQAAQDADWERLAAQNSGWKDEYWTVALSVPLVLCFFPAAADDVLAGFRVLELTPEWYRYLVGVAVAAAFGVRPIVNWFNRRR